MQRWMAIGALIGAAIGYVMYFVVPELGWFEVQTNRAIRDQAGLRSGQLGTGGSVLAIGFLIPFICGLIGAGIGAVLYSLSHRQK